MTFSALLNTFYTTARTPHRIHQRPSPALGALSSVNEEDRSERFTRPPQAKGFSSEISMFFLQAKPFCLKPSGQESHARLPFLFSLVSNLRPRSKRPILNLISAFELFDIFNSHFRDLRCDRVSLPIECRACCEGWCEGSRVLLGL